MREQSVRKLVAVVTYAVNAGAIVLLAHPEAYFELQVAVVLSTAFIALLGYRYPGFIPALSAILVMIYLHVTYVQRGVVYILPYAEVAILSLMLTFLIPLYASVTRLRKLDEAIIVCYYLIAYMLSVAWIRSVVTSFALLASLSTLSSGVTAVVSLTIYSLLLLITTYTAQFSVIDLGNLRAIPAEFLKISKDTLSYEVLMWYSVALLMYLLGFTTTRLIYRVRPLPDRGTVGGMVSDAVRRLAVAIPIALATTYVIGVEALDLIRTSLLVSLSISSLSIVKSSLENVAKTYSYILDLRELIETLKRKISYLEEIASYFRESELESLRNVKEIIGRAKQVVRRAERTIFSTIPSYLKVVEEGDKLRALNSELDQIFEHIVNELRDLIRMLSGLSTASTATYIISLLDEVKVSKPGVTEWGIVHSSMPKISEFLRQQCDAMEKDLLTTIPDAYSEVFGLKLVLRDVGKCSEIGVRAVRSHNAHIITLLTGMESQIDGVVKDLEKLAAEADKLVELIKAYEVETLYVTEFLRIYQDHFSQVRMVVSSDLLSKLSWVTKLKKTAVPDVSLAISKMLNRVLLIKSKIREIDEALINSLAPLEELLAKLEDPEAPLVELVSALSSILKIVFNAVGFFSSIGAIVSNLHKLEKVGPLIEEYIREGLKWGFKFEELFPLNDSMRSLWTLVYGSGDRRAV